jgi:tRNA-splicing ligase RtcB (3'-phosphate/5'-hydroxy nucleic acid ligase)
MCISEIQGGKVKLWTQLESVESAALDQLKNVARLPWTFKHVAVMPDVHYGKGCTVGTVFASEEAVIPAAVGVDIGCGMGAMLTNLHASDLPDSLATIRADIEAAVPVGFSAHDSSKSASKKSVMDRFKDLFAPVKDRESTAAKQIGTLGGGNHFIELCLDTEQRVWLVLHSGSRNIGKTLAEHHIAIAQKLAHNSDLPDPDLAGFLAGTQEMKEYWHDLDWAQQYAFENRATMKELIFGVLRKHFPQIKEVDYIACHHNYVSKENHYDTEVMVTRKGAIDAHAGKLGIIPGSMGTKSYIVRGLGNRESFCSASHGAGRRLSRGAAKREFTVDDLIAQTAGVECRKDAGVLDEIPAAYKDIDVVMKNQEDLVEVVAELRQVMCVKG